MRLMVLLQLRLESVRNGGARSLSSSLDSSHGPSTLPELNHHAKQGSESRGHNASCGTDYHCPRSRKRLQRCAKDKVFALYGLLRELEVPFPQPDYHASVEHIYINATIASVEFDQSLMILLEAPYNKHYKDLPSWVPDWSTPCYGHNDSRSPLPIERGAEIWPWPVKPSWTFSQCGSRLTVRGNIIDTVVRKGPALDVESYEPHEMERNGTIYNLLSSLEDSIASTLDTLTTSYQIALQQDEYPTGESLSMAFMRSLFSDRAPGLVESGASLLALYGPASQSNLWDTISCATDINYQHGGVHWNHMTLLGAVGDRSFFCTDDWYFGTSPDDRVRV